ncbi:hypothetical protein BN2497_14159 [Janthinobacterium sp. CG23_2]|nr:hypothetical protein BN2497_14159 [Janthinobacterium sp. CG23_2]CUU33477.1 hypothetical protein BN3177_14159 [Janthinobacterium sp. CG23_2]
MGKNHATRCKTRPTRNWRSGELFIGTNVIVFMLMNSAPAELLQLLKFAALQL